MYLDMFYRIHLEWMFENQPKLVLELLRKKKLKDHLDKKEQQALRLVMSLKEKHGLSELEAQDQATSALRAPPDGPAMSDHPPKPLDWRQREAVYTKLEDKVIENPRHASFGQTSQDCIVSPL
jgi:hypothetical protein